MSTVTPALTGTERWPERRDSYPQTVLEKHQEVVDTITSWNLSRVRAYLVRKCGYTPEYIDRVITEYRRFMIMTVCFPDRSIPASEAVDVVWHTHILATRDYHAFCGQPWANTSTTSLQ